MSEQPELYMVPREETLPAEVAVQVETGWAGRQLTPANQPIPVLEGYEKPRYDDLPKRTPKDEIKPVYDENTGKLLYKSVSISYVIRMLYKLFPTGWGIETIQAGWANPDRKTGETGEYRVHLQIVAPGLFRPVQGVGSNSFRSTNKQDTEAKTIAGAYTSAVKNAAKMLNIGRDFDEDDAEFAKRSDDRVRTIQMVYENIKKNNAEDQAKAVIRKHDPTVILEDGSVLFGSIEFEELEPIQRELTRLNLSLAKR